MTTLCLSQALFELNRPEPPAVYRAFEWLGKKILVKS
jgi:hypothetical protein